MPDPNIESYLTNVETAVYGRDVRESIVNAIKECYEDVSTARTIAQNDLDLLESVPTTVETALDAIDAAVNDTTNGALPKINNAKQSALSAIDEAVNDSQNGALPQINSAKQSALTAIDEAERATLSDITQATSRANAAAEAAEEAVEEFEPELVANKNALKPRNISYPVPLRISGTENDFYYYSETTWSQGSWTSSGDQESDYWIRTGLLDGGFFIHNKNPDYGYVVGKFNSDGSFYQYTWMDSLVNTEYYYIPDVGSDYKVRIRQRHMTNATSEMEPDQATVEIFRVTGILKSNLHYIPNATVEGYSPSSPHVLSDVAGQGNVTFTIRASYWSDAPFGGVGINMRYADAYDIQIAFAIDTNNMSFRIVNRNTHEVYLDWQTLNEKLASYLKYDNILDSSDYSRLFANVAGQKNLTTNIAFSAWDDVPFGGAGINIQYTANWDLQVIFGLEHNEFAYRFVNRLEHNVYGTGWNLINGNALAGKKVSIIGDSRSSYSGTVPEGNATYYPQSSGAVLTSVSQMWWRRVLDHFGMELVVNDSYSGGYVADPQIVDPPTPEAKILSSDTAVLNLGNTAPDIILIYAGVNDWNGNAISIGTYDGSQTFPSDNTTFREALALLISKVQTKFPEADIWLCTNPYCCPQGTGYTVSNMPVPKIKNSGITLNVFNEAIRDMAKLFGCGVIDFERCGVNWANLTSYSGDMGMTNGLHYNAAGHKLLADVAIATLASSY